MADNFVDNVAYGNSTLSVSGNAIQVGDGAAGAKSIIMTNNNGAGHLAWNPSGNATANIPAGGGTLLVSSQAILSISAGAAAITSGQVIFSNSNGVSFGANGQTITASHNAITSQTNQTVGIYALGNTTAQSSSSTIDARSLSFQGAGIASVGYSAGSVVVSVPSGAPSPVNFSAGTTSGNLGSVVFSNSNGVSFGLNGSTITASAAGGAGATSAGFFATGNTTQNSSTTLAISSLLFNGLGGNTIGYSNGSVQISAPAISSLVGINGISLSSNGSTITINGNVVTYPGYQPYDDFVQVVGQVGQGTLQLDPQPIPNVSFDRLHILIQNSNSSNSSGSHTLRFSLGLYTRNDSTLSIYTSFAGSTAVTHSGTAGSYSLYSGGRLFPITFAATSIPENRYWIAFLSSTASGGANGSYSNYLVSNIASNFTGIFGAVATATAQPKLGQGYYTVSTTALPNAIQFSEINGTASNARRFPIVGFGSSTF